MALHIYHWKHGWIPLDHVAALSKAKGNSNLARRYLDDAHAPDAGIHSRRHVAQSILSLHNVPAGTDRDQARKQIADAADNLDANDLLPATIRPKRGNRFAGQPVEHLQQDAEAIASQHPAGYDAPEVVAITRELARRTAPADRTTAQRIGNLSPEMRDALAVRVIENDTDGSAIVALGDLMDKLDGGLPVDRDATRLVNNDPVLKAAVADIRKVARADKTAQRRARAVAAKAEADAVAHGRYLAAEDDTRGNLLKRSVTGDRDKIGRDLFAGRLNPARMRAVVTPELAEWFATHGWPEPRRLSSMSAAEQRAYREQRGRLSEFD